MKKITLLSAILAVLASVGASSVIASPPSPAPPRVDPESPRLHLNVGTKDTSVLKNLAGDGLKNLRPDKTYVLQLAAPITPRIRAELTNAGVVLLDYLPMFAYAVDLAGVDRAALAALNCVRWIGAFQSDWKVDPKLGRRPLIRAERKAIRVRGEHAVLITLFKRKDGANVRRVLDSMAGAVVHYTEWVGGNLTLSATIPQAGVQRLVALDSVQYIEEAPELTVRNDTVRWIVQSNLTGVTPLYDNGLHGEGRIVGVIDLPVDQQHCSLDGGKILFYNAVDGDSQHGTHVACTAVGDAGVFDDTRGVAYLANMVYDTIPSFNEASITSRLNQHHGQGARVHTNSWGDDGTTDYNGLCRGFDAFLYDNEDDFVCLAVTNSSTLKNPENAKNLLAVGATGDTPDQDSHATGGTGPTADGRRKPEIFAPGAFITSATPSACGTATLFGTSMACPAIAGLAALTRQYYMDGYHPSGTPIPADGFTPSGALLKATLINSAVDMTGEPDYPSDVEGWGRALADGSLFFQGDARSLSVVDDVRNLAGLSTGETRSFALSVLGSGEQLRVTLVWTDAPASASTGTGLAVVNNLDLKMESPSGVMYAGNKFSGGVSIPSTGRDKLNNVEQVHIDSPEIGVWTVRVVAFNVSEALQGFALIATGEVEPEAPVACTPGDMNGDTLVNGEDVQRFVDVFLVGGTPEEICAGDLDPTRDGVVDLADVDEFTACLVSGGCP